MADYIIDMGPEAVRAGESFSLAAHPKKWQESTKGYTPKFLKEELHL